MVIDIFSNLTILFRLVKLYFYFRIRSVPRSIKRIAAIAIIAAVVIFIFLMLGRHSSNVENNPLFDPHANPNIRVADSNHV